MRVTSRVLCNAADYSENACVCVMAERRRSVHAGEDQNNGGTLNARKPRDPLQSHQSSSFFSFHQESYVRQIVPSECLAQLMAMPLASVRSWGEHCSSKLKASDVLPTKPKMAGKPQSTKRKYNFCGRSPAHQKAMCAAREA